MTTEHAPHPYPRTPPPPGPPSRGALTPERCKHDLSAFLLRAKQEGQDEPEIWIRNLSSCRLSLRLDTPSGPLELPSLPVIAHPFLVTGEADIETLSKSKTFRGLLRRRYRDPFNPEHPDAGKYVCELMTAEEARAHFQRVAAIEGHGSWERAWSDADQEIKRGAREVQEHFNERTGFAPPRSAQELAGIDLARRGLTSDVTRLAGALSPEQAQALLAEEERMHQRMGMDGKPGGQLYVEDPVSPRVQQLCHEASAQIDTGLRMPAATFIRTLVAMEHALTEADFDYIQAHGTYGPVKKWAGKKRAERFAEAEPELAAELKDQLEGHAARRAAPKPGIPTGFVNTLAYEAAHQGQEAEIGPDLLDTLGLAGDAGDAGDAAERVAAEQMLSEARSMMAEAQRLFAAMQRQQATTPAAPPPPSRLPGDDMVVTIGPDGKSMVQQATRPNADPPVRAGETIHPTTRGPVQGSGA